MKTRVRTRPKDPRLAADGDEEFGYGPSTVGMRRLAALALGVFLIFVICTLGSWLMLFAANDAPLPRR